METAWFWFERIRPSHRPAYMLLFVVLASGFLLMTVGVVVGPVFDSRNFLVRFERVRAHYVVEDLFLRALEKPSLQATGAVELPEGTLSPFPDRMTRIEYRRSLLGAELRCELRRRFETMSFRASFVRGALSQAFSWALGQGDPAPGGEEGLKLRGHSGVLSTTSDDPNVFPFAIPDAWKVQEDLLVRAGLYLKGTKEGEMNLANFRLAADLPLDHLSEPTDLDDFELGRSRSSRRVAAFQADPSRSGVVVRVLGHLWIGRPGESLLVNTGGRSIVLLVTGNIYVLGDVRMLGPKDSLFLVAGAPGKKAFRDENGNGKRDDGEKILGGESPGLGLRPREGGGLLYLGLGEHPAPQVQASLVANHDVIVGRKGASVLGAVLAGGRLLRIGGLEAGPLDLRAESRFRDMALPRLGLPIVPGSQQRQRLVELRRQPVRKEKR